MLTGDVNQKWVFNWFCLDHVGFTGENPRRRDLGDHKIFDKYVNWINESNNGDSIQWHYHPLPITGNVHNGGTAYLNSNNIWEILAKKIIEKYWFPSVYRPGFHAIRPDSHWFIDQWFPFDFSNQSIKDSNPDQPDLSNGRYGYWVDAPDDWSYYKPNYKNYQISGDCFRHTFRCLNAEARLRVLSDEEITKANKYANDAQEAKKMSKPHNIGALLFFLPGAGITMKNVDEAAEAANNRALHLNKLKEKKKLLEIVEAVNIMPLLPMFIPNANQNILK